MDQGDYVPISPTVDPAEILRLRQHVATQLEGAGLRTGKKAEFTLIAPLTPNGAEVFRERTAKLQAEAAYWESKLGTVHDLRVGLIGDTHILFAATYSDDFKPYVLDVIKFATPWIDHMFLDIADGFPGLSAPGAADYINRHQVQAGVWYASNPDMTPRDVARAGRVLAIFNDLLDAAQG